MKRVLTADDKSLIRALRIQKGWRAVRMMKEFPSRQWKQRTLNDLITKIDTTGNTERKPGSGRRRTIRTIRTADNIAVVSEMICSQENQPGTSKSPREISREIGISHGSVRRIVKLDLKLKTFRRREVQLHADKAKRL